MSQLGYKLFCEDITDTRMGAGTTTKWTKNFRKLERAKEYAEKHYKQGDGRMEIRWSQEYDNHSTNDLLSVMYFIIPIEGIQYEDE